MSRPILRTGLLHAVLTGCIALTGCSGTDPDAAAAGASPSSAPSSAAAPTPEVQRIEVEVTGGEVTGDTGRVPVVAGEPVTLVVTSDVADEVHVHGYDLTLALTPGATAEIEFDATLAGVFEVELHDAGTVLLTLQVQ